MQKKLLEIIVCPICYTKLFLDDTETGLICNYDNIIFPIKKGIPILLQDQAQKFHYKIIDNQ